LQETLKEYRAFLGQRTAGQDGTPQTR